MHFIQYHDKQKVKYIKDYYCYKLKSFFYYSLVYPHETLSTEKLYTLYTAITKSFNTMAMFAKMYQPLNKSQALTI